MKTIHDPSKLDTRRTYRRIPLALRGYFLDDEFDDHPMCSSDISCGGANIIARTSPRIGAHITLHFNDLGRVKGEIIRKVNTGFVVNFRLSPNRRKKIADQLTWLWNRDTLGLTEERTSQRYDAGGVINVTHPNSKVYGCRVIDISLSGAALAYDQNVFELGDIVIIGRVRGEIIRKEDSHFAVRYLL